MCVGMCNCGVEKREERQENKKTYIHTHTLIYVRYLDHVLFRNADPVLFKPAVREATGWKINEDNEALWICFDKPIERLPYEKLDPSSGLVILKCDILEIKEIV